MDLNRAYKYLYISSEHGKQPQTGGIGSYIEEIQKLSLSEVLVLICNLDTDIPNGERDWFVLNDFFSINQIKNDVFIRLVAKAVISILQRYTKIKIIEVQEYLGIGANLIHLQRNKLVNTDIKIHVHCHGSSRYIEDNSKSPLALNKIFSVYAEKVSIELTNYLRFPTSFLYKSYLLFDYQINSNIKYIKRYSFFYPNFTKIKYQNIDCLIFFGKRSAMKGFVEFTGAIKLLMNKDFFGKQIKKIILLGPNSGYENENNFFKELSKFIPVEEFSLPRQEALSFIRNHANHALCVLPYLGDNHPVSVLEVVSCQCAIIAANAGGIPELIPNEFHQSLLFEPNSISLANKMEEFLLYPTLKVEKLVSELFEKMRNEQININEQQLDFPQFNNNSDNNLGLVVNTYLIKQEEATSLSEFKNIISNLNCDFIVLSKLTLSDIFINQITEYINHNQSLISGIIASNFLTNKVEHPFLADGIPALFLNQNYLVSKVIYINKSKLIQLLFQLEPNTKIDSYFIFKIMGLVYLNLSESLLMDNILYNKHYKLLSLCNEIGLNKFDADRVFKLLLGLQSNLQYLKNSSTEKRKTNLFNKLKQKCKKLWLEF
jgi:glycosyltransferase involved in cell wall biosynthesis